MNFQAPPAVLGFVLLAAACSSPPPPPAIPDAAAPPERRSKADEIVAIYNGEPLSWQAVAEKALELNLKDAVDQYVRWRIVEDRRKGLGIAHTPDELARRAQAYVAAIRKSMGEERFKAQLARENATEESYRAQLAGSSFLAQVLTMDKILRYDALLDDRLEVDRMYFVEESDAKKFAQAAKDRGFDEAADDLARGERKRVAGRIPRETFLRSQPPADPVLDGWILEQLLKMKPGEFTGVETSRSNLYYVIRLLSIRPGRKASYADVRAEVFEGILSDPPAQQEYVRWMDREMARCRIEYGARGARREHQGR